METVEKKVDKKVIAFGGVTIVFFLMSMFALSVLMFNIHSEEVTDVPDAPKHYANQ